jgi:hypothetical protein
MMKFLLNEYTDCVPYVLSAIMCVCNNVYNSNMSCIKESNAQYNVF